LCLSVTQKKVSTKVWEFLFGGTESETKENHRQFSRELTARRWWQSNQPRFHFYQGADPYVVVMVAVTVRHINLFDQKSCGTNAFLWDSFSVNFDFDKFLDYVKDTNEKASRTVWGMLGKIPLTDIPARKLIGRVFPRESVLIQC
jgi:hypothetical protein